MPVGCAMRWLAHEPSNVIKTFYQLNRAKGYDDYVHALHHFYCPAQNFVYADNQNNIAIWPNGRYPLKWEGQGQFVLDGTDQTHEWQGWIPQEQNPHIKNPERGFVSSANQDVTDSLYPYYLNWEFTTFERGARVNDLLDPLENADANSLREIQNDNFNLQAEIAVPLFLGYLDKLPKPTALEKQAISMLKNWDYKMDPESIAASIYDGIWEAFDQGLWKDDFGNDPIMLMPDNTRTLEILMDSVERIWVDDKSTPEKEDRMKLVSKAFREAITDLEKKHGEDIKTWQWAVVKGTSIRHLGRIPGMGSDELWIGGGHNMVNATKKHHGPSWRMVVEVGEKPNAYGIYPGGQSGNPGSPFYANMVEDWAAGELRPLYFLESADELGDNKIGEINFTSEK
jgi:penicillin amidase